jgi:hypothetical protein
MLAPEIPRRAKWNVLTVPQLRKILEVIRLPRDLLADRVHIRKGFFDDTVPQAPVEKIALLHLDVDLYDSYRTCLRELFPKVVPGGLVLFDEYTSANYPGARKAIDEYFNGTPYKIRIDEATQKGYLIKD